MSCYVREANIDDIDQVNEIDREAFPTQWPPPNYKSELRNQMARISVICETHDLAAEPSVRAEVRLTIESGRKSWLKRIFGLNARLPGVNPASTIVGFVASWIMADEAHITAIAVRESYRRRGIGERLMIAAVETAIERKADFLTLEVRVSNTGAQALYTKYGFTQVGLRRGYYTDNREDALIMSTDKIISPAFQARFKELKESLYQRRGVTVGAETARK